MKLELRKMIVLATMVAGSLGIVGVGFGQKTWDRGAGTNNWGDGNNWSPNGVPSSTDAVTIPDNFFFSSVVVNVDATCASLSMTSGNDPLTVSINTGITLTVSGAVSIGASTDGSSDKILAVGAGILECALLSMENPGGGNDDCILSVSIGTATVSGNIAMAGSNSENFVNITSTGTLNLGGSITGGDLAGSTGSTVNYNGTSAQTIAINADYIYDNITINNTSGATLQADVTATNVTGDLSVQSGIFNNGGFAITLSAGDNFSVSNGATFNLTGTSTMVSVSGGGTKTFGATSTTNYGGAAQAVTAETYGNLGLSGSGTKTFGGSISILGDLSISGAVANLGAFTSTATTLTLGGADQNTGTWGSTSSPATNQNNTYFSATTGIVNVGAGSQTFSSAGTFTFTVPSDVTSITVEAWGGGGGGGSNSGGEKGGGGGGAYAAGTVLSLTPGSMHTVTVGLGGVPGSAGGASSFETSVIALGGASTVGTTGGGGGSGPSSTGTTKFSGGNGGNAGSGGGDDPGGGGGGSALTNAVGGNGGSPGGSNTGGSGGIGTGNGGNGADDDGSPDATTGIAPGGGGGGKGDSGTSKSGANGQVLISWSACTKGIWLGTTSDWHNAANWCGDVPTASTEVVIPSGVTQPIIGAAAVCRNITIESGASLTITGSNTLAVSGNWSNSGTFTANTSTVTFNGTTQTLGGSSSTTFNNLTIGSSTSTTLGVNTTVGGVLTVNAGSTLALSTFTLGSPSSLVLVDGATMGSSITGSGLLTLGGNVTVNDATTGTDDANISCPVALTNATTRTFTVADDGTSAVDLTITGIISTTGALTKAGLGTMVLSGTNTYTGATLISAGILNIQNPQGLGTTAGGATVSNGARLELEGGIAVGVETLSLAGEGGGSSGGALYNVSGTNSWGGAITLTADTRINSAAGTLTLSNTINLGGNILYLQGASTNANTASGIISGSGGSIQKVGTGTWLLSGANTFTGGVSLYAGTLRINHAQALGTIAGTFTIGGVGNDVTIDNTSGGAITTLNYPMSWNDDFTFTGSNALNLGSGAVTLQESRQVTVSASTLTVGGIINDATLDLTKAGAGTLSFGSNPVTLNNLSIGAGILISTSNTLSLAGNYSNGGTFTHNSGTVRFNGGALQTLGGANSTDFFNLTVDNSGVGLSLSLNQTVNGTLTLTDGLVATGANTLTIANDAPGAISGGSSGSYVNGNLVRSILGGVNTYTYPVGTATAYAPVTIAFGTGTIAGTLHGFTVDGDHPNIPHPTVPSVNRFWRFTINSGLTTANYGATFNWVLADVDPMFDFTTARCGKYSGGMWTLPTMGARMATSAEITGESGFSDFQIGTSAALPVTWLSFRATLNEDKDVDLLWSTASESNNEGFDIERSANARDWETIGFVPGAGTTSEVQTYQYIDPAYAFASAGAALIYYRLKQRDYDGSFEYSPVRTIELGNQNGIRVYPNPADEEVTISFAQPTEVRGTARLYTQNNRLAAEYTIPPQTTDYPVRVAGLPAGIYVLQVVVGNEVWSKRLVIE